MVSTGSAASANASVLYGYEYEYGYNTSTTSDGDDGLGTSSSSSHYSQRQQTQSQFACLYTKHKTQKRKLWHDGRLVLRSSRAKLFHAQPTPGSADPTLDECEITIGQQQALSQGRETQLETERFLIQIEGPWVPPSQSNAVASSSSSPRQGATVSSSMQKLMQRKFQRPARYVPPPPHARPDRLQAVLGKRRRPLQPGELERMHYGSTSSAPTGLVALAPSAPIETSRAMPDGSGPRPAQQPAPPPPPMRPLGNPLQEPANGEGQFPSHHQRRLLGPTPLQQPRPAGYTNQQQLLPQEEIEPTNFTTPPPNNSSFEAPDAFVLQQQTASTGPRNPTGVPGQQQRPGNLQFVRNEFNAQVYYGFEDEEEDEEEEDDYHVPPATHTHQSWAPSSNDYFHSVTPLDSNTTTHINGYSTAATGGQGQDQPPPFDVNHESQQHPQDQDPNAFSFSLNQSTAEATKQQQPRSTSELMALFGAVPITRHSSNNSNGKENNSNDNGAATPDTTKNTKNIPEVVAPQVEATAPINDEGSDQVRFCLPSPSSSSASSDDEEEE